MKGTNTNKKTFGGIIVLILIGVVLGYYVKHHEKSNHFRKQAFRK